MKASIYFILFYLLLVGQLTAQHSNNAELHKVSLEDGFITLSIKALNDGKPRALRKSDFRLIESYKGQLDTMQGYSIREFVVTDTLKNAPNATILFLLDLSNRLSAEDLQSAKRMIKEVIESNGHVNTTYFLTAFHQDYVLHQEKINDENVERKLRQLKVEDYNPDFYRASIESLRFLKKRKGKRTLFALGSGQNDIADNDFYDIHLPYSNLDLKAQVDAVQADITVFCVELGSKTDFNNLRGLTADVENYAENKLPKDYKQKLNSNIRILSTHIAKVDPVNQIFQGEKRNYTLLMDGKNSKVYGLRAGSSTHPISLSGNVEIMDWGLWFVLGTIIILGLLGICSVLVPVFQKRKFKRDFVFRYIQKGAVRVNDPVYNEPIKAGEPCVQKCMQIVPLTTWEEIGGQCPNYPDCMDPQFLGCTGSGAPMDDRFFSRKGIFRPLNWMWYGAIGGFLGWILFATASLLNFQGIKTLAKKFINPDTASFIDHNLADGNLFDLFLDSLSNDLLSGITFGTGLLLMLSYIVELSDSRALSWWRILFRTFLGALISILVFSFGSYLQYSGGIGNTYITGLVTWLIFGVAIGLILSIQSNIIFFRGILGGVLAALIAYTIFIGISIFFADFVGAKLISLIILGAVLGLVLVSVISRLENFELEFIAPKGIQNIPISKWLKNGQNIFIGKEPGSYVYVKWKDPEVLPQHAQLLYENEAVYLKPIGETLVNRKLIDAKTKIALKNKDLIQLGRQSNTMIRYIEKRAEKNETVVRPSPKILKHAG